MRILTLLFALSIWPITISAETTAKNCPNLLTNKQETVSFSITINGSATSATAALADYEKKIKEAEETAQKLGKAKLTVQSTNMSINSNYYGSMPNTPQLYQYSGSASYMIADAKLAVMLIDELAKVGISANMNSNMYLNYSGSGGCQ